MRNFRGLAVAVAAAFVLAFAAGVREAQAVTLTEDTGWVLASFSTAAPTTSFDFTLSTSGVFSLTDCCVTGDGFTLAGDLVGVSAPGVGGPFAVPLGIGAATAFFDPAWLDPTFDFFQSAILAAGTYSFTVTSDVGSGSPGDYGVRLDTSPIPVPAAGFLLLGGLGGLVALRRRKKS